MLSTQDPVVNFEILWRTFQENYAFFKVRGIDWQAQYDKYRPQVKVDMSQNDLFALMSDLLSPIQDRHVLLWSQTLGAYVPYKDKPEWSNNSVMQEQIIDKYLGGFGKIKSAGNNQLIYGKLNDTIGYINVKAEAGYVAMGTGLRGEAAAAEYAIDLVIEDLGDVKTMIVDTRFNEGGIDDVSLTLARRFADQRRLVFSYARRKGDSFTPAYERYLEPGGKLQFTRPVILLTSNYTVSSGETFVLAMRALPNVTIIGERTSGCFAFEPYMLPNGWWFRVSDTQVIAPDGKVYEGVGIPPDIEMEMKPYDPTAKDVILEKAIALAAESK
jgi:hypothetical protein